MDRRIVIFGCGGHARSIINVLREKTSDTEIILVDENAHKGEVIMGCKVESEYSLQENDDYIIAVGDNTKRKEIYDFLNKGHRGCCITVISLNSSMGIDSKVGQGTFIGSNAYVGPLARIGDNTIVNTGSVVEHEAVIGNHVHIAPNATICGRVCIGNEVFCGAGSTVIDKVQICDGVIIGAGAVVTGNIVESGTYVGVPAKKISDNC